MGRCDIGAYEASPPANTSAPVISGGVLVGQVLTCSQGTWSGAPITGYGYQWNRDGAAIPGANGSTYTVGSVLPANVPLYAVPQDVALRIPAIQRYSYTWLGGRAYLVDPTTGMIVDDVTE